MEFDLCDIKGLEKWSTFMSWTKGIHIVVVVIWGRQSHVFEWISCNFLTFGSKCATCSPRISTTTRWIPSVQETHKGKMYLIWDHDVEKSDFNKRPSTVSFPLHCLINTHNSNQGSLRTSEGRTASLCRGVRQSPCVAEFATSHSQQRNMCTPHTTVSPEACCEGVEGGQGGE
jgi:hypothetical protein